MATITVLDLIQDLPQEHHPAVFEHVLEQNPNYWYALRRPADPELKALYPKSDAALAMERASKTADPAPYHVVGEGNGKRIFYVLAEIVLWLQGNDKALAHVRRKAEQTLREKEAA